MEDGVGTEGALLVLAMRRCGRTQDKFFAFFKIGSGGLLLGAIDRHVEEISAVDGLEVMAGVPAPAQAGPAVHGAAHGAGVLFARGHVGVSIRHLRELRHLRVAPAFFQLHRLGKCAPWGPLHARVRHDSPHTHPCRPNLAPASPNSS